MLETDEGRPISRRTFLKGAAVVVATALGAEGFRRATNSQQETSVPNPIEKENAPSKNTPIREIYVGELLINTARKKDSITGKEEFLKLRVIPATTTSKLIDNRRRVVVDVETIPWEKINKLNGVDVKGQQLISMENVSIVHGQNVDSGRPQGDRWVVVDAVINDIVGRDDETKLFFNLSPQTSEFITAEPNPNAPTETGFIRAEQVGKELQILEQGAFWKPFGGEVNAVSLPLKQTSQE